MATRTSPIRLFNASSRWRYLVALALLVGGFLLFRGVGQAPPNRATFAARHGSLDITVLEGGSLSALQSQEIKCEVRVGYQGTKILKIVEEGYQVTEEDVKNGKVLVELDSTEIQNQLVQQEIQYQSAAAAYTDAQQNYEIQVNQNVSDIKAAEQKARFARMDFDKFLGDTLTARIIAEHHLDQQIAAEATAPPTELPAEAAAAPGAGPETSPPATLLATVAQGLAGNGASSGDAPKLVTLDAGPPPAASQALPNPQPLAVTPNPQNDAPPERPALPTFQMPPSIVVDFAQYANLDVLGDGEAKQKLRKFEDDLQVAKKELEQATATLDGTRRLHDKGFVTRTDLQRDEIAYENSRLKVQTAETARDLFLKYEFIKSAEEFLSKYIEAGRELNRARKAAVSKLAQANARLKSAMAQYHVQRRRRQDLQEQLDKCVIRATKPGLVVYGGGRDDVIYYGQEQIREGATVRELQTIITIPDLSRMVANVKIHESYIKKIKRGQKARITIDAFPDQVLTGEVTKLGVLPDSQNRYLNPDMKVYRTEVTIDGTHDWLKPGMSAKVEIFVDKLENVVYVPLQAVVSRDGKQVCYVANGGRPEKREVEVGQFNDEFIEIKAGLQAGELVLLHPPEAVAPASGAAKETETDGTSSPPPTDTAPPTPAGKA
jgi:RND family efflux transporter MFP subunit